MPARDARQRCLHVAEKHQNPKNLVKPNMFAPLRVPARACLHTCRSPKGALARLFGHNQDPRASSYIGENISISGLSMTFNGVEKYIIANSSALESAFSALGSSTLDRKF